MTTEQKAKRFEELLTKAKQIYNKENDVLIIHTIEDLFPELKISEDEEIRKGLIQYFNDFNLDTFAGLDPKKILAWLEKQDNQEISDDKDILQRFSFYSYKDEPNILYLSELYVNLEHRNKGIGTKIIQVADKVAANIGCNYIRLKTKIGSNAERLYRRNGYNTLIKEGNQIWLEKQGKPVEINPSEFDLQLNRLLVQFESLTKEELASSLSFYLNVVKNGWPYENEQKQGEQKSKKVSLWKHWKDGKVRIHRYKNIAGNGEDKPIYLVKSGNSYTLSSCLGYECDYIELSDLDELMLSEKQGKQKPFDYENANIQQKDFAPKSAMEAINEQKVNNANKVEPNDYSSIDPHFGKPIEQKPTDKVEPKFHEGDWTVSKLDKKARQISEVHFDEYNSYYVVNGKSVNLEEYDRLHHLWTIDDARDGDVLHSPSHHLIWIYKDNEHYYACVNMNYATKNVATNGLIIIPNDACPATKDEQTILFARMKEADYEWDAEKKEIGHKHFCELDNSCACVKFPFKAKVKSTGTIVAIHGGQLSPDGNEWIKYQSDAEDGYKIYEPNNLELVCDEKIKLD